MSTQPFGQQPAFGAPSFGQAPEPPPVDDPEVPTRRRTVVIAIAAGVAALAVLGGTAVLILPGSGDEVVDTALPPAAVVPVEPSAPPSTTAAPLPTTAPLGRNVFVPLVDESAAAAEVVDPAAEPVETTATTAPTTPSTAIAPAAYPTSQPTSATVLPGFGSSSPLAGPTVTVTETVEVPGPIKVVRGPLVTSPPIEVTVPGFHSLSVTVEELLTEGAEPRYLADFLLAAEEGEEPAKYEDQEPGDDFGPRNRFVFLSYDRDTETLSFRYVDSVFTIPVPLSTPVPDGAPVTTTTTAP